MPLQAEDFTCGHCGKPVKTEWIVGEPRNGLLRGPYALLGEVFFHEPECVDAYLKVTSPLDPTHY
jgi:hypothetical protein